MKFYGQFDPPVDRFIFERYFNVNPPMRGGVFIECGAFDGETESSAKFFEETLGWKAINIEPSPKVYDRLCKNRPLSNNFNFALSCTDGEMTFTDVHHPDFELCTNGSIEHRPEHKQILDEAGCHYSNVQVRTLRYNTLIEQLKLNRLDLMILDVEGHELSVLEGMKNARILPNVLCVEHGHLGIETVRAAIEPLGYVFDTTSYVNSFFLKRSLAAEVSFLKNQIRQMETSKSWKITQPMRYIRNLFR